MNSLWRAARVFLGLVLRRPIVGVCIIPVSPEGGIVLVRRRDSGKWGLPGGLVDWGEDVSTAAARELAEETNLQISRIGRLVGVYSSPKRDYRFHSVCVALEAYTTGAPKVLDPLEVMEIMAFPADQVMSLNLAHDHAQQMQDYITNKTVIA